MTGLIMETHETSVTVRPRQSLSIIVNAQLLGIFRDGSRAA